jgi:hypothetical protein
MTVAARKAQGDYHGALHSLTLVVSTERAARAGIKLASRVQMVFDTWMPVLNERTRPKGDEKARQAHGLNSATVGLSRRVLALQDLNRRR